MTERTPKFPPKADANADALPDVGHTEPFGMPVGAKGQGSLRSPLVAQSMGDVKPPASGVRPADKGLPSAPASSTHSRFDLSAAATRAAPLERASTSRSSAKVLLVVVLLGLVFALTFSQRLRKKIGLDLAALEGRWLFEASGEKSKPAPKPADERRVHRPDDSRRASSDRQDAAPEPGGATKDRLAAQGSLCAAPPSKIGSSKASSWQERLALAECHLLFDRPDDAERALLPVRSRLMRMSEEELNDQKSSGTLADALHVLVVSYVRQGKLRQAGALLRGRCASWEQSQTCVAKAMMQAEMRTEDRAIAPLFSSRGRLDAKAQARLWLAGALMASREDKVATVDQRLELALATAPRQALALRKHILEVQAISAYRRGDRPKVIGVVERSKKDLAKIDAKAKVKLAILGDLAGSDDQRKIVKRILNHEDVTFRAIHDLELIDILGPPSFYHGAAESFARLVDRAQSRQAEKQPSSSSTNAAKRLALWQVRANLALRRFETAAQQLRTYEKLHGNDVLLHHLRGVMLLAQSERARHVELAMGEFQKALRLRRNWESLHALGLAMLRAGKPEKLLPVLKDLEKLASTPNQRYWIDMLKAEWYSVTGKWLLAVKLGQDWQRSRPSHLTPLVLLVDLYQKMGKTSDAKLAQQQLEELTARPHLDTLVERFGAPFGVLALERRPLD